MTETADGDAGHPFETSDAQKYFRTVEEIFTGLRGAPLLLAPADWRVSRGWYEAGVPLDLVRETLRELTARRLERDPDARVNSLRYYDRAVRGAWKSLREARGPSFAAAGSGGSGDEQEIGPDIPARLDELAAKLPDSLPDRELWSSRVRGVSGSLREVEETLSALDDEILDAVEERLEPADRREIEATVEAAIARLESSHGAAELEHLQRRLFRRELRAREGLPLLTLF